MIKIFNATDTDFKTAGNIIINPLHCHEIKKKSLNGWYIEVEIPIKYKEYIEADKLCVVKTKSKLKPQAFRINDSITYTNRKIKFTAEHVMFDSRRYVLLDVRPTNLNGQNGLKYVNERTDKTSPFSIDSNVENISTAYFIRKTLLESWQVFEERWGGVFEADNWDISFKQSIGKDNGETIVYGKNMQGFEIFEDWSNVCTKILPVGYDGLLLPEKYLESETQYEIPYTKIVDFQTDLKTEEQTETNLLVELRNNASKYLEENCIPKVSYTVNSNVNNDLEIGDTIKVLHPFVNIFTEVLEYEYDLISEKVKSLTFGNYTRDVKTKFNNIKNTIETIKQTVSKQEITIKEQTNLINSLNKNGYVYIDDNEILILDQLPKEKAKNVWRFGLGGIGFSSKGYEGPFETAITMDGKINADFITTGTMAVDRIESLANFITDTSASIAAIELQQDSITTKVSLVENETNSKIDELKHTVEGISNQFSENGGNNLFYYDKEYWKGGDVTTVTLKDIQLGDNLSGKKLILSFPEGVSLGEELTADMIVGTEGHSISVQQMTDTSTGNFTDRIVVIENGLQSIIYKYDQTNSEIINNYEEYTLSDSFGVVTELNSSIEAFNYIKVEESRTEQVLNIEEYRNTEFVNNSKSGFGYIVNKGSSKQSIEVQNGTYTISFKYKKIASELANTSVKINGEKYSLTSTEWSNFKQTVEISANYIEVEFISDTNNALYVADLLANIGTEQDVWTQNPNETRTDTVTIGKGIKVKSSTTNTELKADSDGIRIDNTQTNKTVAEFTDKGTETEELVVRGQAQISGMLVQQVDNQTWISSLL